MQNKKLNKEIAYAKAVSKGQGLKWHSFLIYFSLWFSGLYNIIVDSVITSSGSVWGENFETILEMYPALETTGLVCGALYLILGIITIKARFALARFEKNAPKKLTRCYIFSIALPIAFWFFSSVSVSEFLPISWFASALATCFWAVVNHVYYKKRSYLFVN